MHATTGSDETDATEPAPGDPRPPAEPPRAPDTPAATQRPSVDPDAPTSRPAEEPNDRGAGARRILARPPSERFDEVPDVDGRDGPPRSGPDQPPFGSARTAIGLGAAAGVVGAVLLVVSAAYLSFSAGLVVIAIFLGRIVGLTVRATAGPRISSPGRSALAVVITLAATALAQLATWVIALGEGGVLPLGTYLVETFGPIVPLEFMIGTLAAWWSSR